MLFVETSLSLISTFACWLHMVIPEFDLDDLYRILSDIEAVCHKHFVMSVLDDLVVMGR